MLEYVLLVGDWNGSYDIPTFTIPSYNEDELDVTDYTYTYIGDDVNCLELLSNVGISACPSNAVQKIKEIPGIIQLENRGGGGAVREFIQLFLK